MLDSLLFCQDKLHLIQKGKIKLSEPVIKATEDSDIGQNIFFNETTNKKHKQFMKNVKCKMAFKLNHADFPPLLHFTVSEPVSSVSSSLLCTTASRSFSNKVSALPFKSLTKASNKPFPSAARFCPGNFTPKHLHNPSQSLVFDLARNVPTRLKHYVICKSVAPFEAVAVNVNFAPVYVCQRVNVVKLVFCHPHISFLANPCLPLLTLFVLWLFTMLSLSIQHIVFVECFHPCIVPQVSIGNFLIREMWVLQAFLCDRQIYFLLLLLNVIFHLWLRRLIFHQDIHLLLEPHLLRTFNMCLHQLKFACFLWLCWMQSYWTSQHNIYWFLIFWRIFFNFS